ncbi:MAG: hypothetical protein WD185_05310 [Sneathiella sp.]
MKGKIISSGTSSNIDWETREISGELLHCIKITGPIGLEERIPVYWATLEINRTKNYFALVDHRHGYEDTMSYEDMLYLCDLLIEAGVTRVHTAIVIAYQGYKNIIKLSGAVGMMKNLEVENKTTTEYSEAEAFILSRIEEASARK